MQRLAFSVLFLCVGLSAGSAGTASYTCSHGRVQVDFERSTLTYNGVRYNAVVTARFIMFGHNSYIDRDTGKCVE
jgi:hypothetical protein